MYSRVWLSGALNWWVGPLVCSIRHPQQLMVDREVRAGACSLGVCRVTVCCGGVGILPLDFSPPGCHPASPCPPASRRLWRCTAAGTWGSCRWDCRGQCGWGRAAKSSSLRSSRCPCRQGAGASLPWTLHTPAAQLCCRYWDDCAAHHGNRAAPACLHSCHSHASGRGGLPADCPQTAQKVARKPHNLPHQKLRPQVDGEPFVQAPCAVHISRRGQGLVLRRVQSKPLAKMMQARRRGFSWLRV